MHSRRSNHSRYQCHRSRACGSPKWASSLPALAETGREVVRGRRKVAMVLSEGSGSLALPFGLVRAMTVLYSIVTAMHQARPDRLSEKISACHIAAVLQEDTLGGHQC